MSWARRILLEAGRQPWRRQQLSKFLPAARGIAPRCAFDVLRDHVLPEVVVDDVAAVLIEEADPLLGARARHQGVALEPGSRLYRVDLLVDVATGGLVARIRELVHEGLRFVVLTGAVRIESGRWKEDRSLVLDPLVSGERHRDPIVGRAFRDERLRREKRI